MTTAQTLDLGSESPPDTKAAVQFDFYSQESTLGTGQGLLEEGTIHVYPAKIYQVIKAETSETLRPVPPPGPPLERYLVVLPFTLYRAPGERRYQKIIFRVDFPEGLKAAQLIPQKILTPEDSKESYTLGGSIEVQGVGGTLERKVEVTSTRLRPVVIAYGQGGHQVAWEFTSQPTQEIDPGSKEVSALLEVPRGTGTIPAVITYELTVRRKWLGDWIEPIVKPVPPYYSMPLHLPSR